MMIVTDGGCGGERLHSATHVFVMSSTNGNKLTAWMFPVLPMKPSASCYA